MIAMVTGMPVLIIIGVSICLIIISSARFKVHPFLSLLGGALFAGLAAGIPVSEIIILINKGFGEMAGAIGLIITLGTLIGVLLEESGAAQSIAHTFLQKLGQKHVTFSMSLIGGLVGIPVFCDSGFIMLQAPGKKIAETSGQNPATITLATATGLYATHVLVPPTPGPLAAAGNLGAENYLGMVILIGLITAIPAILTGYAWANKTGKNIIISDILPDNKISERENRLPAFWKSILPICLPLLLIILGTFLRIPEWKNFDHSILQFITHPVMALAMGLMTGILFLTRKENKKKGLWMEKAIMQAGPILLITAAGGAFGAVLKSFPLQSLLSDTLLDPSIKGVWLLAVAFLLAAIIKTSQGSSTASLIIVSSLIAPLLQALQMHSAIELSLMVSAIGAGSMVVSHTNDSYFWVIARFGGMSMQQTLKGFTMASLWMGIVTLIATMVLWLIIV